MGDLPWAPATGQTSLRAIETSEAFVLCENKREGTPRYLFTRDGQIVAIGGAALTLQARVMKPEPAPEPDHIEDARGMVDPPPAPAAPPAQMSLF